VSFGSGTGVPPVNGHGQDGRATANDTITVSRHRISFCHSIIPIMGLRSKLTCVSHQGLGRARLKQAAAPPPKAVILRSRRRRRISHCHENTQSEILRCAQDDRELAQDDRIDDLFRRLFPPGPSGIFRGARQTLVPAPAAVVVLLFSAVLCSGASMALPPSAGAAPESSLERQINTSFARGSGSRADESLDELLNEPHPDADVLLRTGIALAQKGLFGEAARAFSRCVRDYPALFEGHYNLALAELAQEHPSQAFAAIDQAGPHSEEEITAQNYLRGKIEARMGQTKAAIQNLSAAFEKDPGQENYALDLGLIFLQTRAYSESEGVFAQGSALNPQSTYLLLGLALAQFLSGRTSQSMEASRRVLAADPGFSPARLLLGFALYFDGKFAEAREVSGAGLKLPNPDPYLYYLEAVTLFKQHGQEHRQILDDLGAAEKHIPDCALCYVASGKVHEEQNELPAALSDLQKAVQLAPDLSEGWYHLAAVDTRLGHAAEAAKAREHFRAMKVNADEREKEMMRGVLLQSLGAQSSATPR